MPKTPKVVKLTHRQADPVIDRPIPNTLEIFQYLHCALCLAELPQGQSPQDYRRYDIGMTPLGLQVWCTRHDANVAHIDFQNYQLPANTTRAAK